MLILVPQAGVGVGASQAAVRTLQPRRATAPGQQTAGSIVDQIARDSYKTIDSHQKTDSCQTTDSNQT